jgi:long-chain acyl-CoA synthetase
LEAVTTEDVAVINYTSGTTGLPKGVMLTHRNMVSVARIHNQVDPASDRFEYVSYLPLPWIGEQCMAVSWGLTGAFTINFPEKVETVQENIREIGPHIMLAHPRIWEKMCSDIQVRIEDSGWLKRLAFRLCIDLGYRIVDRKLEREKLGLIWTAAYWITFLLVFRSLKNYLGLARLMHCYTGGAPLGPEIFKMFQAMGVNIKQIYGMTEQSGMSVVHRTDDIRLNTVGQALPEMEFTVSDTGELLSRGPTIFKGYYKDPEATEKALEGGWFHSGDSAMFDEDNHIIMIDRMQDVMTLADGSKFSPQLIENKLKFSPYIIDAIVIGKARPYITAMVNIDMGNVGKWAESNQIPYTTFTDLSQKDQVYQLVAKEVARMNKTLPKVARVRRFVLLYKELDPDDDELTRTRKVRRDFVSDKYQNLIDALYGDVDELDVEADIQYQDGKAFKMKTQVKVQWVEG